MKMHTFTSSLSSFKAIFCLCTQVHRKVVKVSRREPSVKDFKITRKGFLLYWDNDFIVGAYSHDLFFFLFFSSKKSSRDFTGSKDAMRLIKTK